MSVSKEKIIISSFFFLFLKVAVSYQNECSETISCGKNGPPIRFPFRLKGRQPTHCGYPGFDLSCTSDNETVLELPLPIKFVFLDQINYESQEIQVHSRRYSKPCFPDQNSINYFKPFMTNLSVSPFQLSSHDYVTIPLINCSRPSPGLYSEVPCLSGPRYTIFARESSGSFLSSPEDIVSCTKMYDISQDLGLIILGNFPFSMEWHSPNCRDCEAEGKLCGFKKPRATNETGCLDMSKPRKGIFKISAVAAGSVFGSIAVIVAAIAIFHVYTLDKNERESQKRIKKFLEEYKAFKPSRYSYADIKKITNHFQNKLGQGAFGTVFKGKLSNDILVAVKILYNSKEDGEEFINEVGTMGRIHHVNVVRLVGYCADGFKRALVYEFLTNDSLEKYISVNAGTANRSLSLEMLQDIALGIARGIEYLHQGCDQRILHFDIKPHNVLLDQNFTPKISDFGMAKLCSKDQSVVSMTSARGTIGYIAPEVFSRNFGNVSYKSDVYSFGMLLLEMVGGRKNIHVTEENTEQIYYPEWIYNLLHEGEDFRIYIEEEEDAKIAKKLAIIGLWCIQWHPVSRPSMKVVVQMLEGGEELTMPPNPFASTGPSKTNMIKMPARHMIPLELETIDE